MKPKSENYITLEFLSRSANEAFARGAVACFAAQLDPTLEELGDIKKRPDSPSIPPAARIAAVWASPSWRASWTS